MHATYEENEFIYYARNDRILDVAANAVWEAIQGTPNPRIINMATVLIWGHILARKIPG